MTGIIHANGVSDVSTNILRFVLYVAVHGFPFTRVILGLLERIYSLKIEALPFRRVEFIARIGGGANKLILGI